MMTQLEKLARAMKDRAAWLVPAIIAVVALVPACRAVYAQSFAILGRDQGIFQYVAWSLRNGEKLYRDVHEINGPLPHAWHMVMQLLGGEDEHVFRTIDTMLLVCVYTLAAASMPRWIGLGGSDESSRSRRILVAVLWGLAGLAVFGSQYARYDWWHTAQREGLYSLLVLSSVALQAVAHDTRSPRRALVLFALAGVTTTLPWFGKPPCAVFALLQAIVLVLDRKNVAVSVRAALAAAAAGGLVVGAGMVAFVAAYGDIGRGITMLSKVPRLHHTIWNETLRGVYHAYDNSPRLDWAMATFFLLACAIHFFKLPRRALLAMVLPIGGAIVFVSQGKAFPYHLHMLTLGTAVGQLLILAGLAKMLERGEGLSPRWSQVGAIAAVVAPLLLGAKTVQDAWWSPGLRGTWATIGSSAEQRQSRAYVEHFPWGDFAANDLRDAAAYLDFHTLPEERIQTYGFDPYLLFLARRKSASPIIYNFELNVDAALRGGPGARPSPELKSWLIDYRNEAEQLVLDTVEASPPAAFALIDRAPFTHPEDAERDFVEHCPQLSRWMTSRYDRAATFGTVRIWLRRDVVTRSAALR
jgi:hypothetical protein